MPLHVLPAAKWEAANKASIANSLLAALPRKDYLVLMDGLEPVTLTYGTVLYEPNERIRHVFFPIDCLVSLLATVQDRPAMEVGLVGREGMVGISLVLGNDVSSARALVQATGAALRMKAGRFHEAFRQCLPLRRGVYRYADAKLAMARQIFARPSFSSAPSLGARGPGG